MLLTGNLGIYDNRGQGVKWLLTIGKGSTEIIGQYGGPPSRFSVFGGPPSRQSQSHESYSRSTQTGCSCVVGVVCGAIQAQTHWIGCGLCSHASELLCWGRLASPSSRVAIYSKYVSKINYFANSVYILCFVKMSYLLYYFRSMHNYIRGVHMIFMFKIDHLYYISNQLSLRC